MEPSAETNLWQLCSFNGTDVPKILDVDSICKLPVSHVLATVPVVQLRQLGFDASGLRDRLGVRAIDLVAREALAGELVNAYGRDTVREIFLKDAEDAILLASTDAQQTLNITPDELLQACQHSVPSVTTQQAAVAVLHQLVEAHKRECSTALVFKPAHPLSLISTDTLQRVGLGGSVLAEVVGLETARRELGDEFKLLCL
jgi:hypothetical protein